MKKHRDTESFLSEKRLRALLNRRHQRPVYIPPIDEENRRQKKDRKRAYRSLVIDFYTRKAKSRDSRQMHAIIQMPNVFSIIRNPQQTVAVYAKLASFARSDRLRSITFDHSRVHDNDLAAERMLGCLAREIQREYISKRKSFTLRGLFPEDKGLETYIRAAGIVQSLNIKTELLPEFEAKKRRVLAVHHVGDGQGDQRVKRDNAVLKIVDHVDKCLLDHGRGLTPNGTNELIKYAGEIILNIQEHAERQDWVVAGYMDPTKGGHFFELAIFNFGRTMADTFRDLPKNATARQPIDLYLQMHQKQNLFSENWREDDLITLLALQGHVSSKITKEFPDRGQGTIDLIEFFQQMHSACAGSDCKAEMAIVSGDSCINFDGKYGLSLDKSGREIIAFNVENDLAIAPDKAYIYNIRPSFFPGTVIAIRFPLSTLEAKKE